jgi:hypothetical protein
MKMDRARTLTDKKLKTMELKIGRIYENSPALKRIKKEYMRYMKMVQKQTESSYKAYIEETDKDIKEKLKHIYVDELEGLTIHSIKYNRIVKKFTQVMAKVNQEALDVANKSMTEVYCINYNQVADECKRVGIKVNG